MLKFSKILIFQEFFTFQKRFTFLKIKSKSAKKMHIVVFDENCCGLICEIGNNRRVPVPLKNVRLNVKVVDFISQVEIYQEYVNSEEIPNPSRNPQAPL